MRGNSDCHERMLRTKSVESWANDSCPDQKQNYQKARLKWMCRYRLRSMGDDLDQPRKNMQQVVCETKNV